MSKLPGWKIGAAAAAAFALAAVAFSGASPEPRVAQAETTGVAVIACENIARFVDGDRFDSFSSADVREACGGDGFSSHAQGFGTALPASGIADLAEAIGDSDGALEKSDFSGGRADEDWDNNQIGTVCTTAGVDFVDFGTGLACTLDVFVFVDDEGPVTLDLPNGLTALENGSTDFSCSADVGFPVPVFAPGTDILAASNATPIVVTVASTAGLASANVVTIQGVAGNSAANGQWSVANVTATTFELVGSVGSGAYVFGGEAALDNNTALDMRVDNDCADGANPALGAAGNGDGVVVFHILVGTAVAGDVKTVNVCQEAVCESFDVYVVGPPVSVSLSLAESVIETNGSTARADSCRTGTPYTNAISPPTSTLARAIVKDADDTILTRVPVIFFVTPPASTDIAGVGIGDAFEDISSNTFFSIDPTDFGEPTAALAAICGGKTTGVATIRAEINLTEPNPPTSTVQLTVGGPPAAIDLVAEPTEVLCDGIETTTITATITDADGAPVADGVPVRFDVFLVGIVTPINTVTSGGGASATFRGLSGYTVGVPVFVRAGDAGIVSLAETSVLMPCNGFDTDGDGLPNVFEAENACLSAQVADSGGDPDVDGLSSLADFAHHTNPCMADSDLDGYLDGAEVDLSEDPLAYCAVMRADVGGDGSVSILDLATVAPFFLQTVTPATARYNQDTDTQISILDLAAMATVFLRNIASCP